MGSGFGPYSDTVLPMLLAEKGTITWLPQKLVYLRTHAGSLSSNSNDLQAYLTAQDEFKSIFMALCIRNSIVEERGRLICFLIRWFAGDTYTVLNRSALNPDMKLWLYILKRDLRSTKQAESYHCLLRHILFWARAFFSNIWHHAKCW